VRERLRALRRRSTFRGLRAVARCLGFDVVRSGALSPVPDYRRIPDSLLTEPAPMPGTDLRLEAGLSLLEGELAPFVAEYSPPRWAPGTRHGYQTENRMYGAMDAEVLYAMLRWLRPRRVLEVGAGWSSLVVADAGARNARDGARFEHVCCDLAPSPLLKRIRDSAEILALDSRDIPPERLAALAAGDVLIIDTSHVVRPGGDVVHLLLELLPTLPRGVLVHVHDFFRPFEYPRLLAEELALVWQEQYLMQALLVANDRLEVLLANHALWRLHPDRVSAVVPSLQGSEQPSALWLRIS
jgi:hypothetical protein